MKVKVAADINWETKIDHALRVVESDLLCSSKNYGAGLAEIVIVLNCCSPDLNHKQRVRLVKSTKTLYVDVMLEYLYFCESSHAERRSKIYEEVTLQLQTIFSKRKIKEFDHLAFLVDLGFCLNNQLNGSQSNRFDSFTLERATGI